MALNSIATLKKGLAQFSKKIKARKDKLTDMLAKNEKISDDDEHWLDHEANTVDEINGGDDVDEDFPAEPQPSRQDILKATSTVSKFIEKMDDPIARKLEGLLSSLNMQLRLEEARNLKDTHLTSYFNRS